MVRMAKATDELRDQMIAEFHSGGAGMKEFCKAKGIAYSTFKNWLYRSKKQTKDLQTAQFVPITIQKEVCSTEEIKVTLKNGISLIISNTFNEEVLLKLIKVLN